MLVTVFQKKKHRNTERIRIAQRRRSLHRDRNMDPRPLFQNARTKQPLPISLGALEVAAARLSVSNSLDEELFGAALREDLQGNCSQM